MSKTVTHLRAVRAMEKALHVRSCGSCTACCTALGVAEIRKEPGVLCQHVKGTGCGIYARRPSSCREYHCLWRESAPFIPAAHRPDRLGLVFDLMTDPQIIGRSYVMIARPTTAGAMETSDAKALLDTLTHEHVVIVVDPATDTRSIFGPADVVENVLAIAADRAARRLPVLP